MYSFLNDYSEGAHDRIIDALVRTNHEVTVGYGMDEYSDMAKKRIIDEIGVDADVHFLLGGTQANLCVISYLLKPYEAVIACDTGHINVHEAGSIEATGHKVLPVNNKDGKLTVNDIREVMSLHHNEHMVKPKMVYISNSTEIGSVYTKDELEEIYRYTKENDLYFFIDGARLANAIMAEGSNLTLHDVAVNSDVFYIGGTKNGLLFGEAVIFKDKKLSDSFRYIMKQRGAILAKGRILGVQFNELFKDGLYYEMAKHANSLAMKIQDTLIELNVPLVVKSTTNQIFPVFSHEIIEKMKEKYLFEEWSTIDDKHTAIRFVTSWDTKEEVVDYLINDLKELFK